MRVPLSWLRDFAPFDIDPAELGRVFDDLGMVVEGVERIGGGLDGVVVARLLSIEPIEGLDRVRLTTVDPGDGSALEVACGAWNIEVGQLVPLATIGTTLPNGMTIGRRKLKKVYSNGMLCSAVELGLGEDAAGILILDEGTATPGRRSSATAGIPGSAPSGVEPGTSIVEALGIEPDVVYDLAIEGNRPDANCIAGVARDAAARLKLPFTLPSPSVPRGGTETADALTSVVNESPDLCPRFTSTVVQGISVGSSPAWMQRRLTLAGMRPINNIVDASNYVMLELGQPTHAYDLDRLPGRGLRVRRARPGEVVRTLDGVDRVLGRGVTDDCLICDAEDTPVGIGGIMGGESSEISDETRNVVLEAANFDPMTIAWTSKRLGLRTEASARFERGVDVEGIDRSVERFCELIATGTVAPGTIDDRSGVKERPRIRLRTSRVNQLLGAALDDGAVATYLTPIGFVVDKVEDGIHDVLPPSFRPDVTIEVDLVEEVARHHGYANIERTVPHSPFVGGLTPYQQDRRLVREVLVGAGVSEAQTPSLLGPGDHARAGLHVEEIVASDAMIQEESLLRASLLPGLLRALAFNAARRSPDVAFFEIGNVWSRDVPGGAELPLETERLAVAIAGAEVDATTAVRLWHELVAGLRLADASLSAGAAEGLHPGRTAIVAVGAKEIGLVGEIDPDVLAAWEVPGRVAWLDVDLSALLVDAPRAPIEQRPVSRFPSADIDLAFVVPDDVPAATVEAALRDGVGVGGGGNADGDVLVDVRLFDVFRGAAVGDGVRSLAYRLRFNALDRTLTDDELGSLRSRAIAAVESSTPARIRA